jgi:uncharacterized OB-fold protein
VSTDELAYPPRSTPFTEPFWQGLRESRLQTTKCLDCEHITFPPKPVCPNCWSGRVDWIRLRGTGVLRSYTEVCVAPLMFAAEAPYILCLVDLDEGVRCLSRIQAAWEDLRPDAHVDVRFRAAQPQHLFEFALVPTPQDATIGEETQP